MKKLSIAIFLLLLFSSFGATVVRSQRPENPGKPDSNPANERSQKPNKSEEEDVGSEEDGEEEEKQRGKSGFAHLKSSNNKLQVKFDHGDSGDASGEGDMDEEDEFEIEEDGDDGLKVRAHENASLVIRNKLAAQTNFPLKVNLDTNELIVSTPKGEKIVTVLPDQAVFNMLAANVLDQLGGKGGLQWLADQVTPTATPSATITPTSTPSATITPEVTETPGPTSTPSAETATPTPELELASGEDSPIKLVLDEDGNLVYEIDGVKVEKFLGIFEVDLDRVVIVSAETGELVEIDQNLWNQILDLLSFD